MSYYPTFRDGNKTIDFILVHKKSHLSSAEAKQKHQSYLKTLQALGLELEFETFSVDEDVIFTKVHAPEKFVLSFAALFDIELGCKRVEFRPTVPPPSHYFATPVTEPNINDPEYQRAPETMSGEIPKTPTSAERIMVVSQILARCTYGEGRSDYGIKKLIKHYIFVDSFPLHDGDYKWTESGPLNDRQILAKFWGCLTMWNKAQPLDLVEKYFGTEHALYFAWLGKYIQLLVTAAILSFLVLVFGVMTVGSYLNDHAVSICKSDIVMCPRCHFSKCPMELLKNSCHVAYISYFFDNWCAAVFAGVISLWATIFMELWQREEAVLQLHWNVKTLKRTTTYRPEFLEKATKKRYSPITGRMEPYIPKTETCCKYTLTLVSVIFMLLIVSLVTFGVMVYRIAVAIVLIRTNKLDSFTIVNKSQYKTMIASVSGASLSAIFIFAFKYLYEMLALKLTNHENHRTQHEFTNAYIYKGYALAFANNYAAVFYIALFKGKFYTYPGDLEQTAFLGGVNTDVCEPTGCTVDLAILLIIIMIFKAFVSNVAQVVVPKLERRFNQTYCKVKDQNIIPQWEIEYLLPKVEKFFIVDEYMDMIIQYGFVNFFIVGFPLAPLFALANNICELRVDSSKVTKYYRRPIPARVAGLGAWFAILQATTYIGVVTNALVLAFTSTFMEKTIWQISDLDEEFIGFINQILSVYDMNDFTYLDRDSARILGLQKNLTDVCYYQGKRYPPGHPHEYARRKDYWEHLALKFLVVVLFVHIVIIVKGIVAYAIPDVPFSVKQQLISQEKKNSKARMVELNQEYMKTRKDVIKKVQEERRKSEEEYRKKQNQESGSKSSD